MPPRKRRPRGHIEELASGSFRASVYAGVDLLTRRPRYLKETTKTYGAAEVALTKLQGQVDGEQHPKTNITVAQAIEQWLDVAKLAETTRDRYDDLIRIYIVPTFGNLPAAKLDAEILERFYARLQRCRALCDGRSRRGHICRPLSGSTVRQVHHIIAVLSSARCGGGTSACRTRTRTNGPRHRINGSLGRSHPHANASPSTAFLDASRRPLYFPHELNN